MRGLRLGSGKKAPEGRRRRGAFPLAAMAAVLMGLGLPGAASLPARAETAAAPAASGAPQAQAPAPTPVQAPAAGQGTSPGDPKAPIDPKPVETVPVTPSGKPLTPQEVTLTPVPVLSLSGHSTWEEAYDKLVASLKQVDKELKRLGLSRTGDAFVVYSSSDDLGFEYEVQLPFSGTTTEKPQGGMKLGGSFAGKVLKFTHTGSFADMDNTYELIANYLDEKNVEQNELYIEQYRSDLLTASPEALEIDILVPVQ